MPIMKNCEGCHYYDRHLAFTAESEEARQLIIEVTAGTTQIWEEVLGEEMTIDEIVGCGDITSSVYSRSEEGKAIMAKWLARRPEFAAEYFKVLDGIDSKVVTSENLLEELQQTCSGPAGYYFAALGQKVFRCTADSPYDT